MIELIVKHFPIISWATLWVASLIGLYFAMRRDLDSLKRDVGSIIDRNVDADKSIEKLETRMDARLTVAESRIDAHDVVLGRVDERWAFMQKTLERIEKAVETIASARS